jgi:putative restriction endonuclease
MTVHERALQVWSVLVLAARNQQILSYTMVEQLTGIPKFTQADILGPIQDYCEKHKLPQLTALVVSQEKGEPGKGFHSVEEIFRAQARVFVYDWLKEKAPTTDELRDADHHAK